MCETNSKSLICFIVQEFGDKILANPQYKNYFISYFYKYESFSRMKQIEVDNPEDSNESNEDTNYIAWKNHFNEGVDESNSEDMFADCENSQIIETNKKNDMEKFKPDGPEELLSLLKESTDDLNLNNQESEIYDEELNSNNLTKRILKNDDFIDEGLDLVNLNPQKHWKI